MYKNILFLDSGSHYATSIIRYIKHKHPQVKIIACDIDPLSVSFVEADYGYCVNRSSDPNTRSTLEQIIKHYNIDYIFPEFENGFEQLSKIDANWGIDFEKAILCKDKIKFAKYCTKNNLPHPKTVELKNFKELNSWPIYIKPNKGSGSKQNFLVKNESEIMGLIQYLGDTKDQFIAQQYLEGTHWDIDVLVDDNVRIAIPKKTSGYINQSSSKAEIVNYKKLIDFSFMIQETLKTDKIFDLEVFEIEDGEFVINEINARMSGLCTYSSMAGCDIISYLLTNDTNYIKKPEEGFYGRSFHLSKLKLIKKI